jgi:hypothetical protein
MTRQTLPLHWILGGLVAAGGAFVMSDQLSPIWAMIFAVGAIGFLSWRAPNVGAVWAWATLMLGIESMIWPIVTMTQIRLEGSQPTEEQMGTILNAVLFGLFSSVFWVTFSLGLFKRAREQNVAAPSLPNHESVSARDKNKRRNK